MSELKVYNLQLLTLLDEKEVFGIAKSIAKWTSSKFSKENFSHFVSRTHTKEIQSKRGVLSGKARRVNSLEEAKPWNVLGVSRRKFFYMKKQDSFYTGK